MKIKKTPSNTKNDRKTTEKYWEQIAQSIDQIEEVAQSRNYYIGGIRHEPVICQSEEVEKRLQTKKYTLRKRYSLPEPLNKITITRREAECILLILQGCTNDQAGTILQLSGRTIEFYIKNLRRKTGCYSKQDLIRTFKRLAFTEIIDFSLSDLLKMKKQDNK